MDILQPLPVDQWCFLRDSLKRDWPTYAYYYSFINTAIKWKKKNPQFKLQIFCPSSDVHSGTFVGISTNSHSIVYVFAFEKSKDLLHRVLEETNRINWDEYVEFAAVHSHFSDVLENFIVKQAGNKNFSLAGQDRTYNYFKPKEECLQLKISVPEGCELRHLNESHIPLVHPLWPHRSQDEPERSTEYLASMVRLNRGIGLFVKKDGQLISWILNGDFGELGALQTMEEHKRKGYGKIVAQAMMKELAEQENFDSIAFVVDRKAAPQKLFETLGFQRLKTATWYYVNPNRSGHYN